MTRRALVAFAMVLLLASPAAAQDTTAVAVNTKDGFSVFRLAFQIRRTTQDVVDAGNAAVAFATCAECQTVALSFQVVLMLSDPSQVTPENLALAYNYLCTSCETLASAYQWVLTTDGPVRFTEEGYRQIAELRVRLFNLRTSDLPIEQIQAEADAIAEDLAQVLANEMVAAGAESGGTEGEVTEPTQSASPTPEASPTAEASPTPSASPSTSPSP